MISRATFKEHKISVNNWIIIVLSTFVVGATIGLGYIQIVLIGLGGVGLTFLALSNPFVITLLFGASIAFDRITLFSLGSLDFSLSKIIGALMVLSWLLAKTSLRRSDQILSEKLKQVYFLLVLWVVLTTLSVLFTEPNRLLSHLSTVSLVFLVPVLVTFVSNELRLRNFLLMLMSVMFLGSLLVLVQAVLGYDPLGLVTVKRGWVPGVGSFPRPGGTFDDPNYFSLYAVTMALPVLLALMLRKEKIWLVTISTGFVILAVFTSASIGGLLGLAGLGVYSFVYVMRRKRLDQVVNSRVFIGTLFAIVLFTGIYSLVDRPSFVTVFVERFQDKQDRGESRFEIWEISTRMLLDNPIFGLGSTHYQTSFSDYTDDPRFASGKWTHNSYLGVAVTRGLPALVIFIGLITLTGKLLWTTGQLTRGKYLLEDIHFALGGMYISYIIQAFFLNAHNDKIIWMLLGLTLALYHVCLYSDVRLEVNSARNKRTYSHMEP